MISKHVKKIIFTLCISYLSILPASLVASEITCEFRQVSKRIYVIVGSDHKTCPIKEIQNPLTNPAIIVGDSGVIIIDPGSSLQVGQLVLERIKSITDKPVVAVFNSHIHGLYWLGNQAVKERYPSVNIYAHQRMIERIINGEGDFWVEAITGKYQGEKTSFILPNVALAGGEIMNIEGITIKIHHKGHAHTDHDLLIELPEEEAVFLGGMVVEPEVPSEGVPGDANFKGQVAGTQYAINLNSKIYIPGRGKPAGIELPKRALKFLEALYGKTQKYYDEDLTDFEISEKLKVDLADYKQWYNFSKLGGVVSQMYLQIEQDNF